ncbi:MAG: 4-oxalocrotonate tautomerase, partial [uncultured Thermomicrobiales bacterium]
AFRQRQGHRGRLHRRAEAGDGHPPHGHHGRHRGREPAPGDLGPDRGAQERRLGHGRPGHDRRRRPGARRRRTGARLV